MIMKRVLYTTLSIVNMIIPKQTESIFIYDGPFMRQNCWALYRYLIENHYDEKYDITFYTNNKANISDKKTETSNILKGGWKRLRAHYVFFEYDNFKLNCKKTKNQISFNIWHGMLIKKIGYLTQKKPIHPYENDFTFTLSTSEYFRPYIKAAFNLADDQIYIGGYPRNDYLFNNKPVSSYIRGGWKNYLWMPTFRTSASHGLKDTEIELPILTKDNITDFDNFLAENKIHIIIKAHPFQDQIEWIDNNHFKSITVINNKELFNEGYELYEFVSQVDGLITDYSSIIFDYLLTRNPILVAMDDFEEYKANRGIVDNDIYDKLGVPVVNDLDMLKQALLNKMNKKEENICALLEEQFCVRSISGNYSKDILDFLNIKL